MSERMAHRGPDAHGFHSFADSRVTVQLAHRRLSIIDSQQRCRSALFQRRADTLVQRGALQLSGDQIRTCQLRRAVLRRLPTPRWCSKHGGDGGHRHSLTSGDVCLCAPRRSERPFVPRPRPDGNQAAVLSPPRRWVVFASELKALVSAVGRELRVEPQPLWPPCSITGCRISAVPSTAWRSSSLVLGSSSFLTARPALERYWCLESVAAGSGFWPPGGTRSGHRGLGRCPPGR